MGKENRCHACNLNDMLEVRDVRIAELEAENKRLAQFVEDCGVCIGCLCYREYCICEGVLYV